MLKIDLHAHTNYIQRNEATCSPKQLIDEAARLGYDAIAITEHYFAMPGLKIYKQDPLKTYRDFKDYASSKGILLVSGAEVRFPEGEVVLFNFQGDVTKIKSLYDIKNLPKTTLRLAPHPFFKKSNCLGNNLERNIGLIDAIEYCHFYLKSLNLNKKAEQIAKKYKKPLLGTSDAHRLYQLNHTYTLVDAKKNPDDIVRAIRNGKYKLKTKPLPFLLFLKIAFLGSIWAFIKYRIKQCP